MSVEFNNPITFLINVFEDLYPGVDCKVHIVQGQKKCLGDTWFPDDGSTPVIQIGAEKTIPQMLDIMAHELAHVVVGPDSKHGPEWTAVYEELFLKYNEKFKEAELDGEKKE